MWHIQETGEMHMGIWWEDLRKRAHFQDLDIDGRIILKQIFKMWDRGMDWIDLAKDTDADRWFCMR
jgi:hypothetical protein